MANCDEKIGKFEIPKWFFGLIGDFMDDTWFSFLQHRQWDILLMDAILDVPSNDGNHQMLKVTVADSSTPPPPPPVDCKECTALACKR
ncbi:hypothetical protein ACMD2_12895 [Ananas comosus]|uniref:Uncharacterized protein n=1 Tax=Ananas comosus TaxID=4615 RepID=A0A199UV13_ANACO|nr:hypothetical protein ACMD2_12895 [Ananas comosus]